MNPPNRILRPATASDALAPEVVRLNTEQAELYKDSGIVLQDPNGKPLAVFSAADLDAANRVRFREESITRAENLLYLLECLVVNQSNGLELDQNATNGLADALLYTRELVVDWRE